MQTHFRSRMRFTPSLPFILLLALLSSLWLAGGASRADLLGQAIVRAVAAIALAGTILLGRRPSLHEARPMLWLLGATIALTLVQLVPLPPEWWRALPDRGILAEAAAASGQAQPWRPLSIVPDATINAACSLIVPVTALVLAASINDKEREWLPAVLLGFIVAAMLLGLLQFSGVRVNNPLINDTPGEVGGTFANRNHFALFLAIGCLLTPTWALVGGDRDRRMLQWRAPVATGLLVLFVLTILATGSRAGLIVGLLGLGFGLLLVRHEIKRALRHYPRWVFPALVAGSIGLVAVIVLVSIAADRAVSISRVLMVDQGQDMRTRGLPTVLEMIRSYFPCGAGFGGFDPLFRMHEPLRLLKYTYFNHAHNDYLEVVLDAGLPGLLLLLAGLSWWVWASVRSWRRGGATFTNRSAVLPRLGSAMLLLIIVASIFDYPVRTPMIMALTVLAGWWLSGGGAAALPKKS